MKASWSCISEEERATLNGDEAAVKNSAAMEAMIAAISAAGVPSQPMRY